MIQVHTSSRVRRTWLDGWKSTLIWLCFVANVPGFMTNGFCLELIIALWSRLLHWLQQIDRMANWYGSKNGRKMRQRDRLIDWLREFTEWPLICNGEQPWKTAGCTNHSWTDIGTHTQRTGANIKDMTRHCVHIKSLFNCPHSLQYNTINVSDKPKILF